MTEVITDRKIFEYDVHSLVKAFYPKEEVTVSFAEEIPESFSGYGIAYGDNCPIKVSYYRDGTALKTMLSEETITGETDRGELKNIVKRTLYRLLTEVTEKSLPWGTLTGIRPTRLVRTMCRTEADEAWVKERLKRDYYVSQEKLNLSFEIVKRERKVIASSSGARGYSLYIGIPFCPTTCLYCSFTSFPIAAWRKRTGEYLDALKKEIKAVAGLFSKRPLDCIYIGGGTPTTLESAELSDLLSYVRESFDLTGLMEFSVEAGRPDSIDFQKLRVLRNAGVNRISINPQTMNPETLAVIGRRHSVEQVRESFYLAREEGFDNINMDLILGLPGEDIAMEERTLDEIERLKPDSVTVHSMAIKRAAGMSEYLKEHEELKSVNTPEMMELAINRCRDMGLYPYYLYRQKNMAGNFENIGFSKDGRYGIYNVLIMEEIQDIAALGAGTVSKRVHFDMESGEPTGLIERCDNVKDVNLYIEKIDEMIGRKQKMFG